MENTNNLLGYFKEWHEYSPVVDRTGFFACLSVIFVLVAIIILQMVFKSLFFKKPVSGILRKIFMISRSVLVLISVVIIYFSAVSTREILMTCPKCGVSYTYKELRICGKLISLYDFMSSYKPQCLTMRRFPGGQYCYHSTFIVSQKCKYWGGIIPTHEYWVGEQLWLMQEDIYAADEPYYITDKMKLFSVMNENDPGRSYLKVVISDDKEYSSPSQSGLSNQSEPEQNQTPVQETPEESETSDVPFQNINNQ
ncbi:MAG: YgzB family protein [Planctomycetaceae bacterium]|jgi:hypothetical protein|nr:YgzB family protein [Planctomycetaceae bacterium]